jgi:dehydrogenase/reductase SDR family protein 12
MLCRSEARGKMARDELTGVTGNERLELHVVDVADLESVADFCDTYLETDRPLHALVHNAGALLDERVMTAQLLETTFACHVVGPFLATLRLMERLARSATDDRNARVVFVSSGGMYTQKLRLGMLERGPEPFDGVIAYAQCKRAQVILAQEFARRYADLPIAFSSMHPGWVETPGVAKSLPTFDKVTRGILRTPDQGADTVVWLAASPSSDDAAGGFYFDRESRRKHIPLRNTESSREDVEALWTLLQEQIADYQRP